MASSALFLLLFSTLILNAAASSPTTIAQGNGEWRLLSPNIGVSAMHVQLLPSNQLLVFDRTDFGPSNLSLPFGHCRDDPYDLALKNDCTAHSLLFDPLSAFVRPLNILTDTWCSSGSLLPDATFLQTGGYNDGDLTVRTLDSFNPLSSDWVEHPKYLSARRWYATNQNLPDGSVIIIGGRRQFNYEFYPKPKSGPNLFDFRFLLESRDGETENNLYPFVHLLPDGNLFVFANTQSVILDPNHSRIVRRLPKITDGISRNYPSSGSSVMLPLRPGALSRSRNNPSATRAEVLICGGTPAGNYEAALTKKTYLPACGTCGRIAVTDHHPVWRMENMPMRRVMGDMVLLPTGDVLIVNGASSGSAGWELGRDPVTAPVLYRPSAKRMDQRFVVLKSSPIPRMYHSTAVLDTFGRVLVGGSNPHVRYEFANVTYPTDLSMEAFSPPYLDASLSGVRPRIMTIDAFGIVGYGSKFQVWFSCGGVDNVVHDVEVAVVAPAFATHSVGMNQRMVVLVVDRVDVVRPFTYETTVWAPPMPEIAPPGYYMMFVVKGGSAK